MDQLSGLGLAVPKYLPRPSLGVGQIVVIAQHAAVTPPLLAVLHRTQHTGNSFPSCCSACQSQFVPPSLPRTVWKALEGPSYSVCCHPMGSHLCCSHPPVPLSFCGSLGHPKGCPSTTFTSFTYLGSFVMSLALLIARWCIFTNSNISSLVIPSRPINHYKFPNERLQYIVPSNRQLTRSN